MTDAESNCFQWLEDLRVLFVEDEDEQRATIPLNGSITLHGKKLKRERDTIKRIGLQLKGLDSRSISDICKGQTSEITFALYVKKKKLFQFAKENQSYLTQFINEIINKIKFTYRKVSSVAQNIIGKMFGFISLVTGIVTVTTENNPVSVAVSFVFGFLGFMLYLTSPPRSVDENEEMIEKLKEALSTVTGIQNMGIKLIEDSNTYDFRVTISRKSLVETKKTDKGEEVPFLAEPTSRPQKFKF